MLHSNPELVHFSEIELNKVNGILNAVNIGVAKTIQQNSYDLSMFTEFKFNVLKRIYLRFKYKCKQPLLSQQNTHFTLSKLSK